MEKQDFLETCVVLSGLDRDSILKTILKEKYKTTTRTLQVNNHDDKQGGLPTGLGLLVHNPSPENFAEYAFELCSLKDNKETITRHLLSIHFDAAVEAAKERGTTRVRTRQSKVSKKRKTPSSSEEDSGEEESNKSLGSTVSSAAEVLRNIQSVKNPMPEKLNLFSDGKSTLTTMVEIIPRFFPGAVLVHPGIYSGPLGYVLLVVDNGRFKNYWRSAGTQNKLTWYTSGEDVGRKIFDEIVRSTLKVHVVRKRNGEMRYMGKSLKIDEVNKDQGSCVMYVA